MMMRLDKFFVEEMQKNGFDVDFKRLKQIYLDTSMINQFFIFASNLSLIIDFMGFWCIIGHIKFNNKEAQKKPTCKFLIWPSGTREFDFKVLLLQSLV